MGHAEERKLTYFLLQLNPTFDLSRLFTNHDSDVDMWNDIKNIYLSIQYPLFPYNGYKLHSTEGNQLIYITRPAYLKTFRCPLKALRLFRWTSGALGAQLWFQLDHTFAMTRTLNWCQIVKQKDPSTPCESNEHIVPKARCFDLRGLLRKRARRPWIKDQKSRILKVAYSIHFITRSKALACSFM